MYTHILKSFQGIWKQTRRVRCKVHRQDGIMYTNQIHKTKSGSFHFSSVWTAATRLGSRLGTLALSLCPSEMSREGYDPIPAASPPAEAAKNEDEDPSEIGPESSHHHPSDPAQSVRYIAFATTFLLLILAYYVGKTTSAATVQLPQEIIETNQPTTRLCEVYTHDKFSLIQTSLAEPSKQWSEVACVHHNKPYSSKEESEGYTPSASIDVDFAKIAYPNRPPILGFGGAFTEATALNFMSLNDEARGVTSELLFGKEYGLGYRWVFAT